MAGVPVYPLQWLLLGIFLLAVPAMAAPYLKTGTGQGNEQLPLDHLFRPSQGLIGPLFRQNDHSVDPPTHGGCYYQFNHYDEGDRIITNEPCLNCTCHNSMLMCYLKVCPFSKPIGQDCTVEKDASQCCPVITCPQVPVNLQVMQMSSTTTLSSVSTEMVPFSEHGCTIDGEFYTDGAKVPGDLKKPCELCYCIRNHTACLMQECILKVEGCNPVFEAGICCPVRYKCSYEIAEITTTMAPSNDSLITTTMIPQPIVGCTHKSEFYMDGAMIPSEDPCEHCYCMNNDIVCAIQECRSPLDEEDENCKPRAPLPGKCCPEAYDCPETPEMSTIAASTDLPQTVPPFGIIAETTLSPIEDKEIMTEIVPEETETSSQAALEVEIEMTSVHSIDADPTKEPIELETDVVPVDVSTAVPDTIEPKITVGEIDTKSTGSDVSIFETRTTGPDADDMFLTTTPMTLEPEVVTDAVDDVIDVDTTLLPEVKPEKPIAEDKLTTVIPEIDTESPIIEITTVTTEETETEQPSITEVPFVDDKLTSVIPEKDTESPVVEITTMTIEEKETEQPIITESSIEEDKFTTVIPEKDTESPIVEFTTITIEEKETEQPIITERPIEEDKITTLIPEKDTESPIVEITTMTIEEKETEQPTITERPIEEDKLTTEIPEKDTESPIAEITTMTTEVKETKQPIVTEMPIVVDKLTTVIPEKDTESPIVEITTLTTEVKETEQPVITEKPELDTESTIASVETVTDDLAEKPIEPEMIDIPETEIEHDYVDDSATTSSPVEAKTTLKPIILEEITEVSEIDETTPQIITEEMVTEKIAEAVLVTTESVTSKPEDLKPTISVDISVITQEPVSFTTEETLVKETEQPEQDVTTIETIELSTESEPEPITEKEIATGPVTDIPTEPTTDMVETEEAVTDATDPQVTDKQPITEESITSKPVTEDVTEKETTIEPVTDDTTDKESVAEPVTDTTLVTDDVIEPATDAPVVTDPPIGVIEPKIPGEGDCLANGTTYASGNTVPITSSCQESCLCKNSVVTCQLTACPSPPPIFLRCETQQNPEECCPIYDCPVPEETVPSPNCIRDEKQYIEGDFIPSPDLCTDCYCLYGDIVCAFQECPKPQEGCTKLETPEGSCCPSRYECSDMEAQSLISETTLATETEVPPTSPISVTVVGEISTEPTIKPGEEIQEDDVEIEPKIPGGVLEGCWWFDNNVYNHGETVPSINDCAKSCICNNGTVDCDESECEKPTTKPTPIELSTQSVPEPITEEEIATGPATDIATEPTTDIFETEEAVTDATDPQVTDKQPITEETITSKPVTEDVTEKETTIELVTDDTPDKESVAEPVTDTTMVTDDVIEPATDAPVVTDDVTDKETVTESATDTAIVTDDVIEVATDAPVITDDVTDKETVTESATDTAIVTDDVIEPATDAPVITDDVTDKETVTESATDTAIVTDDVIEPATDAPVVTDDVTDKETVTESATDTAIVTDDVIEPATDVPVVTDDVMDKETVTESATDTAIVTDDVIEPATDAPVVPEDVTDKETVTEATTDAAIVTDDVIEPATDAPVVTDDVTDKETVTESATDTAIVTDDVIELATDSPVVTEDVTDKETVTEATTDTAIVTDDVVEPATDAPFVTDDVTDKETVTESATDTALVTDDVIEPATNASVVTEDVTDKETVTEATTDAAIVTDDVIEPATDAPVITDDVTDKETVTESATDTAIVTDEVTDKETVMEATTDTAIVTDDVTDKETVSVPITDQALTEVETTEAVTDSAVVTVDVTDKDDVIEAVTESVSPTTEKEEITTVFDVEQISMEPISVTEVVSEKEIESSTSMTEDAVAESIKPEVSATTLAPVSEAVEVTEMEIVTEESTVTKDSVDITDEEVVTEITPVDVTTTAEEVITTMDVVTEATDIEGEVGTTQVTLAATVPADIEVTTEDLPDVTEIDKTDVVADRVTQKPLIDETDATTLSVADATESVTDVVAEEIKEVTTQAIAEVKDTTSVPDSHTETPSRELLPPTTEPSTLLPETGDGCWWHGNIEYEHGQLVPPTDNCQKKCYCNDGVVKCKQTACPPSPPVFLRCDSHTNETSCCPVHDCTSIVTDLQCNYTGQIFSHGEYIPSDTLCTDCYCLDGEVICATIVCSKPNGTCIALEQNNDECCPSAYECEDTSVTDASTLGPIEDKIGDGKPLEPVPEIITHPEVPEDDGEQTVIEEIEGVTTPKAVEVATMKPEVMTTQKIEITTAEPATTPMISQEMIDYIESTYIPPAFNATETTTLPSTTIIEFINATETSTGAPSTTTPFTLVPGSCLFDGKVYVSAQQIPRDDPCDFCFCFRGDIICLQQTCPPPIPGCYEEAIPGFCCPRYECPVHQSIINITTTTQMPYPRFPSTLKTSRETVCEIEGEYYAVGQVVKAASSPCLQCICGSDGFMKCLPMECESHRKAYRQRPIAS